MNKQTILLAAILLVLILPSAHGMKGDFNGDYKVDFKDFAKFATVFQSRFGDPNWNPIYDISEPNDGFINELDLLVFAHHWLDYMVLIPGGEFLMGDHFSDGGSNELPVHLVKVNSFYMSPYEITNGQYCEYLNSANEIKVVDGIVYSSSDANNSYPYCATQNYDYKSQIDYSDDMFSVRTKNDRDMSNDPMVMVSWYGAVAYCDYYGYRLPTEAEWEYAARGGEYDPYYRFPWGDTISHSQANYKSEPSYLYDVSPTSGYHPDYWHGQYPYTAPVCSFQANGYGLYDMAGNAWEWCNDWYSLTYYSVSPYDNPQGPLSGTARIIRGGGWYFDTYRCRVAYRFKLTPVTLSYSCVGFRVVLDYE